MSQNKFQPQVAKGQLWKTADAYIRIMERGRTLIQYKLMRDPQQKAVKTQMSCIAEVENYLKVNGAKLLKKAA
jgi:hypothetical protein